MQTLIITEKPSVARDFAQTLHVHNKQDGYMESDRYIITWAVGHLVTLKEPQEYNAQWGKWDLNTLPIIPTAIEYKPIEQSKKQLKKIQTLINKKTFEKLIVATDAGREGEVIARSILIFSGFNPSTCPSYRFWTSQALTPAVINQGLSTLKPLSHYDRLWNAGQSRQIADWLVGMNLSRGVTLSFSSKDVFSVGRVQTAVLSLLVDRFYARQNFVPTPYWLVHVDFKNTKGDHADLKEALVALDKGAWVSELRLSLMYSDLTWDFTIKGENFHLTGLKHPKVEQAKPQEDVDGAILEKVYLWSVVPDLIDRVFFLFLKNRLDPSGWEKTTKQMKDWIRSYD